MYFFCRSYLREANTWNSIGNLTRCSPKTKRRSLRTFSTLTIAPRLYSGSPSKYSDAVSIAFARTSVLQEKASSLAKTCHERSAWFRTDHLLVPFGSDFQFTDAESKFRGMDSILSHINANQDVRNESVLFNLTFSFSSQHFNMTIRYTTLSEYFDAVQSTNASFPTYSVSVYRIPFPLQLILFTIGTGFLSLYCMLALWQFPVRWPIESYTLRIRRLLLERILHVMRYLVELQTLLLID